MKRITHWSSNWKRLMRALTTEKKARRRGKLILVQFECQTLVHETRRKKETIKASSCIVNVRGVEKLESGEDTGAVSVGGDGNEAPQA